MMNNHSMAQIIGEVERSTKLRVYSKKYSIISYIYENNEASSTSILANCPLASSTFFASLQDLKRSGIVRSRALPSTQPLRRYRLSDQTRALINSAYLSIDCWMRSRLFAEDDREIAPIYAHVGFIEQSLNIRYYSIEFCIVIHLYEMVEARAVDIFNSGKYSSTSFYYTLKRLADMGILSCNADASDNRSKIYALSDHVRSVLDRAHRQIVDLGLLVN